MAETNNILEVKNLSIQFGGLRAVDGLNMTIRRASSTVLSDLTVPEKPPCSTC